MEDILEGLGIGEEQVREFTRILQKYNAGLQPTKRRIISSENWWKLRNSLEEGGGDGGFQSKSGWLHNVIVSKHADAMDSFPQPVILPREESLWVKGEYSQRRPLPMRLHSMAAMISGVSVRFM